MLGALLHDIGHMPFSHASEECTEEAAEDLEIGGMKVALIRHRIDETLDVSLRLAEVLSVLVIISERFRRFMEPIAPRDPEPSIDFFLEVAAFIAGARLTSLDFAYSLVLSGPLDADRLDYMIRDAHVSGVPVSVDISRLLARCAFVNVPTNQLPSKMRKPSDGEQTLLFVTDVSGANALEELAVSRFMLNDRIYNHQKTQAAQAVLAELIHRSFQCGLLGRDLLDFWSMTDESFLHRAAENDATAELAARLLDRNLPKRALVFSNREVERPAIARTETSKAKTTTNISEKGYAERVELAVGDLLDDIDEDFRLASRRQVLQQRVLDKAKELAGLIHDQTPRNALQMVLLRHRPENPFASVGDALVLDADSRVASFKSYMPLDQWSNAYDIQRKFGFVFCDPGWEQLVNVAAELVLWDSYSINEDGLEVRFRLRDRAMTRAKLSVEMNARLREILDSKGVFQRARLLRPLRVAETNIEELAERFQVFQGAGDWKIDAHHLRSFVRQFPFNLQNFVIRLLRSVKILDRSALVGGIRRQFLEAARPTGKISVIGFTPNSGRVLASLAEADLRNELGGVFGFEREGIASVAASGNAIFLIDDLVGSGSQGSCQLQAWMGLPRDKWHDPEEENVYENPLEARLAESVKKRAVRMVYAYGNPAGKALIEKTAAELGFSDFRVLIDEHIRPSDLAESVGRDLVDYLRMIGSEVLATVRGNSPAQNEHDALGYGGTSAAVVTMFNVPTCWPAALWCPGSVSGTPWLPLFIRRGYQHRVIFT